VIRQHREKDAYGNFIKGPTRRQHRRSGQAYKSASDDEKEYIDREYVDQLTGEKLLRQVVKTAGGRHVITKWSKIRDRHEALDLEVYSFAALHILLGPQAGRVLRVRAAKLSTRPEGSGPPGSGGCPPTDSSSGTSPEAPKPAQPAPRPARWMGERKRGWVQGWRR
jgi:phage terminase large subunit GpA-like protein